MSAGLPGFAAGQPLRADALAALAARVRELTARQAAGGGAATARRRVLPGRRYAFQLAEMNGVIFCRQGWIDAGNGQLVAVGASEWNAVGPVRACTVWLEVLTGADGQREGRVVQTELDLTTPETNLRRRLGYVRPEDGTPMLHCVQVLGGLVTPAAPRRVMGVADTASGPAGAESFKKLDAAWYYRHAGGVLGSGYTVDGEEKARRGVALRFTCEMGALQLPPEDGGNRLALQMSFN